jgi:translation initiation factor 4A
MASIANDEQSELKEELKNKVSEPSVSKKEQQKYVVQDFKNWDDLDLDVNILRGLYAQGYEHPSPIQSKAIDPFIKGYDLIAQAQSGTGKTCTFCTSVLQSVDPNNKNCQAILISPTRELAEQTYQVMNNIGQWMNVSTLLCIGKTNINESIQQIQEDGCSIVIGTPGRVIDMIDKNIINPKDVKMMVFDEADELLKNSFLDDFKKILRKTPTDSQICLFSASYRPENLKLTEHFMKKNTVKILIKNEMLTLDGISQFYINVEREEWKFATLLDLFGTISSCQTIVYVNTIRKANWLKEKFIDKQFTASVIHSELEQYTRREIMEEFRGGNSRILVSTDLTARGIDVQQVSVVINYDIPTNIENYLHRIGRSGRYGRKGVAINFVTNNDVRKLKEIEDFYTTQITAMPTNVDEYI